MQDKLSRLLIIEDNPGDARLIEEMIKEATGRNAIEVVCAHRLFDGIELLNERGADVALLDLGMPESDGIETFTTVYAHAPDTPIIVLTGNDDDVLAARALREGAQDYLVKGEINASLLYRSIRYAIERKRAEEQLRSVLDVQRLLLSELDHRVRNNLTSLVSLIDLCHRQYSDSDRFAASMRNRVQTMATVHTLLSHSHWSSVQLRQLLHSLVPGDLVHRITMDGPDVVIPVRQVTALGMVLNEFFTNSLKHGALSTAIGRLEVRWSVQDKDGAPHAAREVTLDWIERDGRQIKEQPHPGVGTNLVEGLVNAELGGSVTFNYDREGVAHHVVAHLDEEGHRHKYIHDPMTDS